MTTANPAAGRWPIAAATLASLLAGVIMPSPLYELYRRTFDLTPAQISFVFAVYAASLIPTLIFLGGISDTIGRRRTMLIGLSLLAIGSLVFAFAGGFVWLVVARLFQGLAMGITLSAAIAAITEWMDERQRKHAGRIAVIATGAGSAVGALLGGAFGQYSAHGAMLPYLLHVGLLVLLAAAIARVPSCPHVHPNLHSAVLSIPPTIRWPFWIAASETFISWGTVAVFLSLVPTFLDQTLNLHNLMVGALIVTVMQAGTVTASFAGDKLSNRSAIITAMLVLGGGMWSLLLAVSSQLYALIALAAVLVGAGMGLSYLAGLRIVEAIAPPEHRAHVTSAYLVAAYAGFSLPALAVGLAANWLGLFSSFVAAAFVLGAIALTIIALTNRHNLKPEAAATRSG